MTRDLKNISNFLIVSLQVADLEEEEEGEEVELAWLSEEEHSFRAGNLDLIILKTDVLHLVSFYKVFGYLEKSFVGENSNVVLQLLCK